MAQMHTADEHGEDNNVGPIWPQLLIDRKRSANRASLVAQIVTAIAGKIQDGALPLRSKMPSVRQLAKVNTVSTFTVAESYDRLVELGLLASKPGAGYFVARSDVPASRLGALMQPEQLARHPDDAPDAIDALTPDLYSGMSDALAVGTGWLPPHWYGEGTVLDAVRLAMRIPPARLRGYGHPLGFPTLRQHLAGTLSDELFAVDAEQIVLTHGATHAFDLILRTLTKPGDKVLVEQPCYGNLLSLIAHHGVIAVGVARDARGLDFDALQAVAIAERPRLMFVNTVLQNPLGTSLSQAHAHRLLSIAEQADFTIVEDDIYRDLAARGDASLAALDGLRRVIRVGSFSKTLSPVLRVGSIAAPGALLEPLLKAKMLSGLTTSEINERAVYHAIAGRPYKRLVERLVSQLDGARDRSLAGLCAAGLIALAVPRGGMFVSAGWSGPAQPDWSGKTIADLALKAGILLAPDDFFTLAPPASTWFRFNAAYADTPLLLDFLRNIGRRRTGEQHG